MGAPNAQYGISRLEVQFDDLFRDDDGMCSCCLCDYTAKFRCRMVEHIQKLHINHRLECGDMCALLCKCTNGRSTDRHWHCISCYKPLYGKIRAINHIQKCCETEPAAETETRSSEIQTKKTGRSGSQTTKTGETERRRTLRSKRPTVKCFQCGLLLKKKNLKVHMKRKHGEEAPGLPGYCVDVQHGVFAIRRQMSGPDSFIHVQKEMTYGSDGHLNTKTTCDDKICREALSVASRLCVPISDCEHTQAASCAKTFKKPAELDEEKLNKLFPQNPNIRNPASTLNKEAASANACAVYPLFEDSSFKRYLSFSVYGGVKPTYYSLCSRTVTKYDVDRKTWICDCCKRRGCPHKTLAKWFVYETNPAILGTDNGEEDEGELDGGLDESTAEGDGIPHGHVIRDSALHYPPESVEEKKKMVNHWLNCKLIPYDLPVEHSRPGLGRIQNKEFHPTEEECPDCHVPLSEAIVITGNAVLLTRETKHEGYTTYFRECPQCRQPYRYQEVKDGVFNFDDHWLLSNDWLISLRERVNVHIPVESEVQAWSKTHGHRIPHGLMLSALQMYEAMTDRQYAFSCVLCGDHPPVLTTDLQRKACFKLKVETLPLPPLTNQSDVVDIEAFWNSVSVEKLTTGLLKEGERNPFSVSPSYQWAPYVGPRSRGTFGVNTEHRKVIRGSNDLEEEVRVATEEQMAEMLYSSEIPLQRVKDLCRTCGIKHQGTKREMVAKICEHIGKSNKLFNKVFKSIYGASGGWLSASCPHGIVYGVKFCLRAESPRDHVDLILSMAHQPPIVINDMPHVVARHGNKRLQDMFHPHEGRLVENTPENIEAAKNGELVVNLDWLEAPPRSTNAQQPSTVDESAASKCHPVLGSVPHLCLYDRFHERNTKKEEEILRRVTHSPQLNGLVNTQTAEQLHRSTVRSQTFLNMMCGSTHINMFRNILDSRNRDINETNKAKVARLLSVKQLSIDASGRLSVGQHADHAITVSKQPDTGASTTGSLEGRAQGHSPAAAARCVPTQTPSDEKLSSSYPPFMKPSDVTLISSLIGKPPLTDSRAMDEYVQQASQICAVLAESREQARELNLSREALLCRMASLDPPLVPSKPETPGDGNCLYHALAYHVGKLRGISCLTHLHIRNALVDYMQQLDQDTKDRLSQGLETSFDAYVNTVRKPGTWGDHLALVVASMMFQMRFAIVSTTNTHVIEPPASETWPLVYIGHLVDFHFMSLDLAVCPRYAEHARHLLLETPQTDLNKAGETPPGSTSPTDLNKAAETPPRSTSPADLNKAAETPRESTSPADLDKAAETPPGSTSPADLNKAAETQRESTSPADLNKAAETPPGSTSPTNLNKAAETPRESTSPADLDKAAETPPGLTSPADLNKAAETPRESTSPTNLNKAAGTPPGSTSPTNLNKAAETPPGSTSPTNLNKAAETPRESTSPADLDKAAETPPGSTSPADLNKAAETPRESTSPTNLNKAAETPPGSTSPADLNKAAETPRESTSPADLNKAAETPPGSTSPTNLNKAAETPPGSTSPTNLNKAAETPRESTSPADLDKAAETPPGSTSPADLNKAGETPPGSTSPTNLNKAAETPRESTSPADLDKAAETPPGSTSPADLNKAAETPPGSTSPTNLNKAAETPPGSTSPTNLNKAAETQPESRPASPTRLNKAATPRYHLRRSVMSGSKLKDCSPKTRQLFINMRNTRRELSRSNTEQENIPVCGPYTKKSKHGTPSHAVEVPVCKELPRLVQKTGNAPEDHAPEMDVKGDLEDTLAEVGRLQLLRVDLLTVLKDPQRKQELDAYLNYKGKGDYWKNGHLNDKVIDAYMLMLRNKGGSLKVEVASCFTIQAMYAGNSTPMFKKKEWSKVNIVLIPFNLHREHWCLLVLDVKGRQVRLYDPATRTPSAEAFHILRNYIQLRNERVPGDQIDIEHYINTIRPYQTQMDDCSCGVFVCMFAKAESQGQEHIPEIYPDDARQTMIAELLGCKPKTQVAAVAECPNEETDDDCVVQYKCGQCQQLMPYEDTASIDESIVVCKNCFDAQANEPHNTPADMWAEFRREPRVLTCRHCGNEYHSQDGLIEGPSGIVRYYSEDSGFCTIECEKA